MKKDYIMKVDFEKAKEEAERALRDARYLDPPVDPEEIAEGLGVPVRYATFEEPISSQVRGLITFEGELRIIINKAIPAREKIVTIAHELGHYLLHREWAESNDYRVMLRGYHPESAALKEEQEADYFAENLLVPYDMLAQWRRILPVRELATLFTVPDSVIYKRLRELDQRNK